MPIDNDDILQIKIKFDAADIEAVTTKVKSSLKKSTKDGIDEGIAESAASTGKFPQKYKAKLSKDINSGSLGGTTSTSLDAEVGEFNRGTFSVKGKTRDQVRADAELGEFNRGTFSMKGKTKDTTFAKAVLSGFNEGSFSGKARIKDQTSVSAVMSGFNESDALNKMLSGTTTTGKTKEKFDYMSFARGAMGAMHTARGGSLMGGVSAAGSLGATAGVAGLAVGGLAVAAGAAMYAIKKATEIINFAGESLKEYNGNIFAASVQLEYFWMGLKFKVGKYLEDVLPQLMKQSAAMLGELVMTGAVMLKELAPALMAVLKGATIVIGSFAVEMKAVGWIINVFAEIIKSTTIHLLETGIAAVSFARWVNEKMGPAAVGFMGGGLTGLAAAFAIAKIGGPNAAIHAMQQTIKDIKDGVFNIADNTKKEEEDGFKITTALFSGLKAWSHEKDAKDFGEIKVDGFKAAGNPKNILKDMVGLDPAKDFFLNGAGAAGGARFPGPERHHNNFQAAEKIVFEFSDYDRINFAIQNAVAEMISKCVSANDARFAMIQGGLARITS